MRSLHAISNDVFAQLGFSNKSQTTSLSPVIICNHALQKIGFETSELFILSEKHQKKYANIVLGIGATAYVLVQIGNYFSENPQSLYTLGEGLHALWNNWDSLIRIWQMGDFLGFEHIWSVIEAATHVTYLTFDYGLGDLINGTAHFLDAYSLGVAVAATLLTKHFFNWLNMDKKAALARLTEKIKDLNRVATLAEKAVPPAYLRNEIAKIGDYHFAY